MMQRRTFLRGTAGIAGTLVPLSYRNLLAAAAEEATAQSAAPDEKRRREWLERWERNITSNARSRYCDNQTGEELGWLVSPFLDGFYYGYKATGNPKWVELFVDWTAACINRAVKEPDGFPGWPKGDGGGNESKEFTADSLLGEAMLLRPIALMTGEIRENPKLAARWGAQAEGYIELTEKIFQKWESRDCWREVKEGGLWVVPSWGIDLQTGDWSAGYKEKKTTGFSNPANKENRIALWMLALFDVTQKPIYRQRATSWFQLMKSRMKTRPGAKYLVWNYWDPAGPWDYKWNWSPKHWVGVHPNGRYYASDVEGIVSAFEHGLVFTKADIDQLIATNRDFMWNRAVAGAKFQRIDGEQPDPRWADSPGVLWAALAPYDAALEKVFVANHDPASWEGLFMTPRFLAGQKI
jgi:hypothetical protein